MLAVVVNVLIAPEVTPVKERASSPTLDSSTVPPGRSTSAETHAMTRSVPPRVVAFLTDNFVVVRLTEVGLIVANDGSETLLTGLMFVTLIPPRAGMKYA